MIDEQQLTLELPFQLNAHPHEEVLDVFDGIWHAVEFYRARRALFDSIGRRLVLFSELQTEGSNLRKFLEIILRIVTEIFANLLFVHPIHIVFVEHVFILDGVVVGEEHQPAVVYEDAGNFADHGAVQDLLCLRMQDAAKIEKNDGISERGVLLNLQVNPIFQQGVEQSSDDAA